MDTLHELAMSVLKEQITTEKAVHWIVAKKIANAGIELSDAQIDKLTITIGEDGIDGTTSFAIEMDFGDDELERRVKAFLEQDDIIVSDEEAEAYEAVIDEAMNAVVRYSKEDAHKLLLAALAEDTPTQLAAERKQEAKFNEKIHRIWGNALDKLRVLLSISLEAGSTFNAEYRPSAAKNNDFVFEALVRLHARGCQVGREILVLLSHGLADGALARWRTLHELSIVAGFIKEHGQDVAERYLLHQHIDNYKGMEQHQKHCRAFGMKPLSKKEMRQAKHMHDTLVSKYGRAFRLDYGWAAVALRKPNPTFADIEESVGLEHWRLQVKVAHHHNHATSRANYFNLAIPQDWEIMAAGASIFGLYEPGVQTAYSLTSLLMSLLFNNITLDHIAIVQAVMVIGNELYEAFGDALDASEANLRE